MALLLQIPRRVYDEMIAHAQTEQPNECCGLLSGVLDPENPIVRIVRNHPLINALASPVRYEAEPGSLLAAFKEIRREGWEMIGVYHSHPTTPPVPSRTDLASNGYGAEVAHFIISLTGGVVEVRGWHLDETAYREANWEIV